MNSFVRSIKTGNGNACSFKDFTIVLSSARSEKKDGRKPAGRILREQALCHGKMVDLARAASRRIIIDDLLDRSNMPIGQRIDRSSLAVNLQIGRDANFNLA